VQLPAKPVTPPQVERFSDDIGLHWQPTIRWEQTEASVRSTAVPAKNLVRVVPLNLSASDRQAAFAMTSVLRSLLATARSVVRSRAALHLEVLALRHQVQVLREGVRCVNPIRLRCALVLMQQPAKPVATSHLDRLTDRSGLD
jgi:hypothetical protein